MLLEGPSTWTRVLEKLENSTPDYVYKNWFSHIRELGFDGSRISLGVPNLFHRDWILDHYGDLLRRTLGSVVGHPVEVEFSVDPRGSAAAVAEARTAERPKPDVQISVVSVGDPAAPRAKINDRYTFDSFVVGPSNQLAAAAALAVADKPGRVYNPLFIYGGSGLGKTHLLHAIGNRILERDPGVRLVPTSAEQFLNEFVVLLRKGRMEDFRRKFRQDVDVLMMDDIQFLKKEAQETQNELFHTFNELHAAQKAIILTSDVHPNELANLESRLRSRFAAGLIADVFEPPFEVRVAILKRKAELERLHLSDDVVHFVANGFKRNVRELEGALTRLAAHTSLTGKPLTLHYAEEILHDMLPAKQALSMDHVIKVAARYYRLEVEDLKGERRTRPIAHARAVAMYFCRKLIAKASLPAIADGFGGKHHTTVLSAVEKTAERRAKDPEFARELEEIERQIGA